MKNTTTKALILFCIVSSSLCSFAHIKDSANIHIVDEVYLSANRYIGYDNEKEIGYGIGINHSFFRDRKLNLIFGIEYNKYNMYIKSWHKYSYFYNIEYNNLYFNTNIISPNLCLRLNFGKKPGVFIEPGVFFSIPFYTTGSGVKEETYTYNLWGFGSTYTKKVVTDIDHQKAYLSKTVGGSLGLGMKIPISKVQLVVKPNIIIGSAFSYKYEITNKFYRLSIGIIF